MGKSQVEVKEVSDQSLLEVVAGLQDEISSGGKV